MNFYINHQDTRDYVYPLSRKSIYIKLETNKGNIKKILFVYNNKIKATEYQTIKMDNFNIKNTSSFYCGVLESSETIKYVSYYFKIISEEGVIYYTPNGVSKTEPTRYFMYADTNSYDVFKVPSWAEGINGYQIFPDRFNISNKPLVEDYVKWEETPTRKTIFGGNLRGIIDKIEYLKDLNVDLIYLTPIFKSHSNHKYDTDDYFEIDPCFGTKEDLTELVKKLHEVDIKIVIDGVFNHIGYYSEQFQDVIAKGYFSDYFKWFYISDDFVDTESLNYECVGHYKWMPKLRYETKEVREYIKSVGKYWLSNFHIDGYRLDVADEVDYTFWQEFRAEIKQTNPEAILIGETWKNGKDLIRGDQMDSVMNYRLRDALIDYIVHSKIDSKQFAHRIEAIYFDYPKQTHNILYNLLGSHDTERIRTLCNKNKPILNQLLSILYVLPGIPFIYYGDEVGITGENDPLSRKTMNWNKINNDYYQIYKSKTSQRKYNEILKKGDFKHIDFDKNVYGLVRNYKSQYLIFITNPNNYPVTVTVQYLDTNTEITLSEHESEIITEFI